MSSSAVSFTLRVAAIAFVVVCLTIFFLPCGHKDIPFQFASKLLDLTNLSSQRPVTAESVPPTSRYHPFQIKLNDQFTLARYLRHQPENGQFQNALAVVFEETIKDEPLLLTHDPVYHTVQFHSIVSSSSSSKKLWVIPDGNYAVGVGDAPPGATSAGFRIESDGRLTFNREERWGYCFIPETRGVALYWFGDDTATIPKGCVSDVQLARADYQFPMIEERGQVMMRWAKRRFDSMDVARMHA
jgi:hypothetical protein